MVKGSLLWVPPRSKSTSSTPILLVKSSKRLPQISQNRLSIQKSQSNDFTKGFDLFHRLFDKG